MQLKPGVRIHGLRPEMVLALLIADHVFAKHMQTVTVTSVIDGRHSRGSLHYVGLAVDLRTRDMDNQTAQAIVNDLRAALGADFDVVLESNHIHLECQPKEPY